MSDPLINRRVLDRYRIIRPLAEGGMGQIYLARSEGAAGFTKPVVIKRIIPDYQCEDSDAEQFFVREARILSQIRHPGIVHVVDFGHENGAYLMVLEYVHGFNLGQWLKYHRRIGRQFSSDLAIHITCLVLDALRYAHHLKGPDGETIQVVHRDVTPSNVLVDVEGVVKLADFGIARVASGDDEKTSSGLVRGKMSYLAPELFDGDAATVRTDIYSVGVMLHELLIGRNELRTDSPELTLRRVLEHELTPPSEVRSDVSSRLDAVIAKATAKDHRARYRTAEALHEALLQEASLSQEEGARRMRASVPADFLGDLPVIIGAEPLATLDRAWRSAGRSEPPPRPMVSLPPDEGPTVVANARTSRPELVVPEDRISAPQISTTLTLSLRSRPVLAMAAAFAMLLVTSISMAVVFTRRAMTADFAGAGRHGTASLTAHRDVARSVTPDRGIVDDDLVVRNIPARLCGVGPTDADCKPVVPAQDTRVDAVAREDLAAVERERNAAARADVER